MDYLQLLGHDAFRYGGGLNKSAAEIYWCLKQEPMTPTELVRKSGRARATVYRALRRLSAIVDGATGEVFRLVEQDGEKWRAREVSDLDQIARIIGTAGKGSQKQDRFRLERQRYHGWLADRQRRHRTASPEGNA